ncbi:ROK family protein [Phytoactinopolyspora limicola]|uniref:ROK family protein n=1 Tax=Phytoactinopolyspora limicola TaxID=2715536 RepID=UPI00140924E7|nr:ROK family protein [Phytoactinopolyspora limicola]
MNALVAGIEAGGTKFVCTVGTGPDDLRAVKSFPTTTPHETLGQAITFVHEQQTLAGAPVAAIGIACFGPVDLRPDSPTFGHITSTPKPSWGGTDVVGMFRDTFGVPVGFDTDVNGAALAESQWGAGVGLDPLVYVTVGTGVGGGVLVNGGLLHGLLHPEVGHVMVRRHVDDHFAGLCPYHGDCLEGLASGPAIQARWERPATDLGVDRDQAVKLESWYLAQLAASLTYLLSPERIIMGGGVLKLPGLLDAVRADTAAVINRYVDVPATSSQVDTYVVPPGLGDRAGILGGVALAQRALTQHTSAQRTSAQRSSQH